MFGRRPKQPGRSWRERNQRGGRNYDHSTRNLAAAGVVSRGDRGGRASADRALAGVIECRRARSQAARCDLTEHRGQRLDNFLRGINGRQQYSEEELSDAITAYANAKFHRENRAWRLLTGSMMKPGFLDDVDLLEQWVNRGRAEGGQRRQRLTVATEQRSTEQEQRAAHDRRMEFAGSTFDAMDPEVKAEIERSVLASLPKALQAICHREAGNPPHGAQPFTPTTSNSRMLRAMVLIHLAKTLGDHLG